MRFTLKLIGFLLTASGLGGAVFTFIGLVDPQQAQLANGSDHFGATPSAEQLMLNLALSVIVLGIGLWLLLIRSNKPKIP